MDLRDQHERWDLECAPSAYRGTSGGVRRRYLLLMLGLAPERRSFVQTLDHFLVREVADRISYMRPLFYKFYLILFIWFLPASSAGDDLSNAAPKMGHLMSVIVTWLSANYGLPAIYDHPNVKLVSAEHISDSRYAGINDSNRRKVVAVYDDATATIFLREGWSAQNSAHISVLVHEMVHHLQNLGKLEYKCSAAREKIAYTAQAQWLSHFSRDLFKEFDLDHLTLKLATECTSEYH